LYKERLHDLYSLPSVNNDLEKRKEEKKRKEKKRELRSSGLLRSK
jgi:hypothetical protein